MGKDLDVRRAAERLGVSEDSIRRWARRGVFPNCYDVGTESRMFVRIPESDLEAIRQRIPALELEAEIE